jgi:hypothetical protein
VSSQAGVRGFLRHVPLHSLFITNDSFTHGAPTSSCARHSATTTQSRLGQVVIGVRRMHREEDMLRVALKALIRRNGSGIADKPAGATLLPCNLGPIPSPISFRSRFPSPVRRCRSPVGKVEEACGKPSTASLSTTQLLHHQARINLSGCPQYHRFRPHPLHALYNMCMHAGRSYLLGIACALLVVAARFAFNST